MANRKIPTEKKVEVMYQCLTLEGVAEAAAVNDISPGVIYYWFNKKVLPALPEVLTNEKPGPKPTKVREESSLASGTVSAKRCRPIDDGRPEECPHCHSSKVWKNGLYWVVNWLTFLCFGWFSGAKKPIQRYRCGHCGREIPSPERLEMAEARRKGWIKIQRLISFSKFKLGLSHRRTQLLSKFAWGKAISIGFVDKTTQKVGHKAKEVIGKLGNCRQKVARVMMGDETFPKIIDREALRAKARSVAMVICEFGLIRGVRSVSNRAWHMKQLFQSATGQYYQPIFFLSDFQVQYPKIVQSALESVQHLKDLVHALRLIDRYFSQAVREVTLDVPKGLPLKERQKQHKLKKRLLRKQLTPLMELFFKAFAPGYEPVAAIYIEGSLALLQEEKVVIQNESVQNLHKKLCKFFKKHGDTLLSQLEQRYLGQLDGTTNALESKNSIFAPFRKVAKCFQKPETCENVFNGIALMENFDEKMRGKNAGTSAIQRAGINLADLGGRDFFEVVGLSL